MRVDVTKTMNGSTTGLDCITYQAGQTYDMPDDLGTVFVREGWGKSAEPCPEQTQDVQPDPVIEPGPEQTQDYPGPSESSGQPSGRKKR